MNLQDLMSSTLLLGFLSLDQINELMLLLMAREEQETTASSSDEQSSSSPARPQGWRPTMSVSDILSEPLLMSIMTSSQIADLMYLRLTQDMGRDDDEGNSSTGSSSSSSNNSSTRVEREEAQRRRLVRRRPLRSRHSIVT
ncbi:hypothetical protein HPB50_002019 [Hyalomma asiaticum]|uniref:Uncharacterized protein n=1 Tax=Hyalomma asiaticum TaxID=266040 RepID=A0ACB7T4V6_HYAAI|nr:hypothetical protein HPB50_002019 [Hyalomma asiaticum]